MIYERARRSEIMYRQGQGLPRLDILKLSVPSGGVAFSSSSAYTPSKANSRVVRSVFGTDSRPESPPSLFTGSSVSSGDQDSGAGFSAQQMLMLTSLIQNVMQQANSGKQNLVTFGKTSMTG